MKRTFLRKVLSVLLVLALCLPMLPRLSGPVSAAEQVRVQIVSFMRQTGDSLRVSELLQARVDGYEGNTAHLTYKWTNNLGKDGGWFGWGRAGTYLYVFNTHNMYTVQGTAGEQEIYNSDRGVSASSNMSGRTSNKTFSGTGFAYAAVYGANTDTDDYQNGSISVEVYDGNTLIGSATYDQGFAEASLDADLDDAVFGVFVGETISVKDLLGESAIVHVPCTASNVSYAQIVNGGEYISLSGSTTDYYITGLQKGVANISISLEKENCKFHQYLTGSANPKVHVFMKPTVTPGLTTLTLTEVDPDCTYYLDGEQGVKQPNGTILFEDLNPSTTYEIEVRGHYKDTDNNDKTVYTFVYGTTLTPNVASVVLRLDSIMVPAEQVGLNTVFLQTLDGSKTIELTYDVEGKHYIGDAENGTYGIYNKDANGNVTQLGNGQHLLISNTNATTTLNYYTLTCDPNGGTYQGSTEPTVTVHYIGATIPAPAAPSYPGNRFLGWQYEGNLYQPGQTVNASINGPLVLTAQWEDAIDVYVNIRIHHFDHADYRHNNDQAKHNIDFTVDARQAGSSDDYTELASHSIQWDGLDATVVPGFDATNEVAEHKDLTTYTATAPTFVDLQKGLDYTLTTAKSGYELLSVTKEVAENGDVTLNAELMYAPDDYDFTFHVELDEEAKALPDGIKPIAVNVKVSAWHDTPYDSEDQAGWFTVPQNQNTYYRVSLDQNGQGSGVFPVAKATTDGKLPYSYRIQVVSFELPDGTVMPALERNAHVLYATDCGHYSAAIEVEGGNTPSGSTLPGAYYDSAAQAQEGTVTAVVSIVTHKLTLLANSGQFSDSTQSKTIDKLLTVPALTDYVPTRDGGYVFEGWYLDENGNGILDANETTALTAGTEMNSDLTAIARYHQPLTIKGDITAEYFYKQNGKTVYIPTEARLTETTVILRRRLSGAETYSTYAEQVVSLDASQAESSTAAYAFTGIPACSENGIAYEYIMAVRQSNYTPAYDPEYEYDTGLSEHRYAAKPVIVDHVGIANAVLSFTPETTVIPFQVDATLIADPNARPVSVEVVYNSAVADNTFLSWVTISQHENGNTLSQSFTDGVAASGEGVFPVWNTTPDGRYEYLYQLQIVSYTLPDGTKVAMENNKLLNVYYGNHVSFDSTDKTLTARLSPLPFTLSLDTNQTEVSLQAEGYHTAGASQETEGDCYHNTFYYGTGVNALPTPVKAGWAFLGWFDAPTGGNEITQIPSTTGQSITLYAHWEEHYTVNFHANLPIATNEVFRTYYPADTTLPEGSRYFHLEADNTLPGSFYNLPVLSFSENNDYIFTGWYLDPVNEDQPLDWDAVFTGETDIYAHWIHIGEIDQHETDTKELTGSTYREYDLAGVQIRKESADDEDHLDSSGNVISGSQQRVYSGLRFVAVLSSRVYNALDALSSSTVEYGFVISRTDTAEYYAEDRGLTQLQYRGSNVNGEDTGSLYNFVQNMRCSGVTDHFSCDDYRLYTGVITYKNQTGQDNPILARAYLRYTDANGLLRTYYNNYTGTNLLGGCSASYTQVYNMLNPDSN